MQRGLRGLLCCWPSITEWEMYITAQGCRLRNDLYCVEWDVKLYYTTGEPWFKSSWHPHDLWVACFRAFHKNCSCALEKFQSVPGHMKTRVHEAVYDSKRPHPFDRCTLNLVLDLLNARMIGLMLEQVKTGYQNKM